MNQVVYKVIRRQDDKLLSAFAKPPFEYKLGAYNIPNYGEFFVFKNRDLAITFAHNLYFSMLDEMNVYYLAFEVWECMTKGDPRDLSNGINFVNHDKCREFWKLVEMVEPTPKNILNNLGECFMLLGTYTTKNLLLMQRLDVFDRKTNYDGR